MKRFALKLALFLLLGATLNVAVAWGIEVRAGTFWETFRRGGRQGTLEYPVDGNKDLLWSRDIGFRARAQEEFVRYKFGVIAASEWGIHQRWVKEFQVPGPNARWSGGLEHRDVGIRVWVGWPLLCLYEERLGHWWTGPPYAKSFRHRYSLLICDDNAPVPTAQTNFGYLLPYRVLWPGFAINTIFYASILWLLFTLPGVPFALRRRRRIRRGLCPKCAYDLRGGNHAACPECGRAVKMQ